MTEFPEDDVAGWLARKRPDPTPRLRPTEAAQLLKIACAADNRSVTDEAAVVWYDVLKPFTYAECEAATRKFRKTAMPGTYLSVEHVRELVLSARHEAHEKGAAKRGLPTGPPASEQTRAEVKAAAKRAADEAKAKRQQAEAEAQAEKGAGRREPAA